MTVSIRRYKHIILVSIKKPEHFVSHLHQDVSDEVGDHRRDDQVDLFAGPDLHGERLRLKGQHEVIPNVPAHQQEAG